MKFPYIPISTIIADVRAEMKTLNQAGEILEDDCKSWIIECMREIGGANYDTKPAVIHVKNNVAQLPADFYTVEQMFICNNEGGAKVNKIGSIWFTEEDILYYPSSIIYPGDAMTGTRYCKTPCVDVPQDVPTYIIRYPNQLRCGISNCTLGLLYLALMQDSKGNYLIQDEIHTLKAAKAFVKTKLLEDSYYSQQLPRAIWIDINQDYRDNVDLAQAVFKFPNPADDKARGKLQDARYNSFKLR